MPLESLQDVLRNAAENHKSRGLICYPLNNVLSGKRMSYAELFTQAEINSQTITNLKGYKTGCLVVIHLDDHLDTIVWFWSAVLAGAIPVLSTPFSNIPDQRQKHIQGLTELLKDPIWLTRSNLLPLFGDNDGLSIHTTESLSSMTNAVSSTSADAVNGVYHTPENALAILMLTSGSTGSAKAVSLSHKQVLAAVKGKASVREIPPDRPFLNWIGLDHVASLLEIHLQAMSLNIDQVHVHAVDVVSNPATFLALLSKHRVARSFAPNFFLARLKDTLESGSEHDDFSSLDLSDLAFLASGGEANDVQTAKAIAEALSRYGAPGNVIVTGFGMTETCAGAIFNLDCPAYDIQQKHEFTSLGKCMPGIEMRITLDDLEHQTQSTKLAGTTTPGNLEVKGAVVFEGYYNNEKATREAFTADGWFRTGDQAMIDEMGNLRLIGRVKETMDINGVKHLPHEVEMALAEHEVIGSQVARVVCFPYRTADLPTEQICILYVPKSVSQQEDIDARMALQDSIIRLVMLQTGARPSLLRLVQESQLPKSTLGKISRAKLRTMYENGTFATKIRAHDTELRQYRLDRLEHPVDEIERALLECFTSTLSLDPEAFGVKTPIFEMGVTSIDLIRLKRVIEIKLSVEIPVITIMQHPTIRSLAAVLRGSGAANSYNPVVTLRNEGTKTPLWLIHPGVGEVLVFIGLSKYINDRPVYALRARGFDGEPPFGSIDEALAVYFEAITAQQPAGPYAIAGYSYGTMLAFELSKMLEGNGSEVRFLGSFNLPPHIKARMKQLNWNMCLLHLSYFLGLITEIHADAITDMFRSLSKEKALWYIVAVADTARLEELSLTLTSLGYWANLAYGLQSMAVDYEPSGSVAQMDVFHATPLSAVARSREDWVKNHISKWKDFCRSEPRFHDVDGAHYTMIGPDHVFTFSKRLKQALRARGL